MQAQPNQVLENNIRYFETRWNNLEPRQIFRAEAYILQKYLGHAHSARLHLTLADLGCGAGRITKHLHLLEGATVIGMDIAIEPLWRARSENPSALFVRGSLAELPIATGAVDFCICAFNGLDYIYPAALRRQALVEMRRVLKPGGIVVFSSHNLWAYFTTFRILRLRSLWSYYTRRNGYLMEPNGLITYHARRHGLLREVAAVGLQVLEVVNSDPGGWWRPWVFDPWLYYVCRLGSAAVIGAPAS
ncbi:MAG: class I SAM-dependent methyltransferase [Syntrophobacteraceae bacterium]|jgi:SAM-dependent methyltransferase